MKTLIPIFIAVALVVIGCTEEIIKIQKEIIHDTLKVEKFVDRYFAGTDTVEIPVIVEVPTPTRSQTDTVTVIQMVHDTIWAQRIDSVWITKTVYLTDTVVVREVIYKDTLYLAYKSTPTGIIIPEEVQPIEDEFWNQCFAHGIYPNGGPLIIEIVPLDPIVQAYSFIWGNQQVIRVNDNLTTDEMFLPIMRELARLQLHKVYSDDPESVMNRSYPAHRIRFSNRAQHQTELNEFFQ